MAKETTPTVGASHLSNGLYNSDIMDGIAQIRYAFLRSNLKPPTMILLESHDEGMRFLSNIRQTDRWTAVPGSTDLGKAVTMADGFVWMECKIMGIAVRWPAERFAKPDGSFAWV